MSAGSVSGGHLNLSSLSIQGVPLVSGSLPVPISYAGAGSTLCNASGVTVGALSYATGTDAVTRYQTITITSTAISALAGISSTSLVSASIIGSATADSYAVIGRVAPGSSSVVLTVCLGLTNSTPVQITSASFKVCVAVYVK